MRARRGQGVRRRSALTLLPLGVQAVHFLDRHDGGTAVGLARGALLRAGAQELGAEHGSLHGGRPPAASGCWKCFWRVLAAGAEGWSTAIAQLQFAGFPRPAYQLELTLVSPLAERVEF